MRETTRDVLNGLIQINNDRIERYKHAIRALSKPIEKLNDIDLKLLKEFAFYIEQSAEAKAELKEFMIARNANINDYSTTAGKMNEAWFNFKTIVSGSNRKQILNTCLSMERAVQKTYENALKQDELTAAMGEVIAGQRAEFMSVLKQIKNEHAEMGCSRHISLNKVT